MLVEIHACFLKDIVLVKLYLKFLELCTHKFKSKIRLAIKASKQFCHVYLGS